MGIALGDHIVDQQVQSGNANGLPERKRTERRGLDRSTSHDLTGFGVRIRRHYILEVGNPAQGCTREERERRWGNITGNLLA